MLSLVHVFPSLFFSFLFLRLTPADTSRQDLNTLSAAKVAQQQAAEAEAANQSDVCNLPPAIHGVNGYGGDGDIESDTAQPLSISSLSIEENRGLPSHSHPHPPGNFTAAPSSGQSLAVPLSLASSVRDRRMFLPRRHLHRAFSSGVYTDGNPGNRQRRRSSWAPSNPRSWQQDALAMGSETRGQGHDRGQHGMSRFSSLSSSFPSLSGSSSLRVTNVSAGWIYSIEGLTASARESRQAGMEIQAIPL